MVAADGVNSGIRTELADVFRPTFEGRRCRYVWFGTDKVFDAFTFDVRETDAGVMQVHAYPYDETGSTLIVEMTDEVWQKAGFAESPAMVDPASLGVSDSDTVALSRCEEIFADLLDGHRLIGNKSRWVSFTTVRCDTWHHENVVLLGDAAHTAHFSIGSGTKLAMEDALSLAACLSESGADHVDLALAAYEAERKAVVVSTQRAAQASLEWFENLAQYTDQEPMRFAFNLLTRSRRVTYENLQLRDPEFVQRVDDWFAASLGFAAEPTRPPMFHPLRLRGITVPNRIVVSPMDMYSSDDGIPGDFHLVHLGSKALGGAGLVMTEMVCVSPAGRITPGCTGLWNDDQRESWRRVGRFRARQHARQDRHPARPLRPQGLDPADVGGHGRSAAVRQLAGGRAVRRCPTNPTTRRRAQLSLGDLAAIKDEFLAAGRRAVEAGFDLLELHCAHGYLLSSFLSPLTQSARRRLWRPAGKPAALPAGDLRRPAGLVAG